MATRNAGADSWGKHTLPELSDLLKRPMGGQTAPQGGNSTETADRASRKLEAALALADAWRGAFILQATLWVCAILAFSN